MMSWPGMVAHMQASETEVQVARLIFVEPVDGGGDDDDYCDDAVDDDTAFSVIPLI